MRHWQKPQIRKFCAKKSPLFTANHIPATSGQWKEKSIFVQKKTELEVLLVFKAKSVVHFLWLMQLFEHKSFHNMTPVETLWDDIVKDCFCWWFSDDSGNRREKVRGNSVPGISWHRIYFQSSDFQLGQGNLLTLQICHAYIRYDNLKKNRELLEVWVEFGFGTVWKKRGAKTEKRKKDRKEKVPSYIYGTAEVMRT